VKGYIKIISLKPQLIGQRVGAYERLVCGLKWTDGRNSGYESVSFSFRSNVELPEGLWLKPGILNVLIGYEGPRNCYAKSHQQLSL
jgi:hypothetical protein